MVAIGLKVTAGLIGVESGYESLVQRLTTSGPSPVAVTAIVKYFDDCRTTLRTFIENAVNGYLTKPSDAFEMMTKNGGASAWLSTQNVVSV